MKLNVAKVGESVKVWVKMTPDDKPIFIYRVTVGWHNASGEVMGSSSYHPMQFIEPANLSVQVLFVPRMDGAKKVSAEAWYEEIDGFAETGIKPLGPVFGGNTGGVPVRRPSGARRRAMRPASSALQPTSRASHRSKARKGRRADRG